MPTPHTSPQHDVIRAVLHAALNDHEPHAEQWFVEDWVIECQTDALLDVLTRAVQSLLATADGVDSIR